MVVTRVRVVFDILHEHWCPRNRNRKKQSVHTRVSCSLEKSNLAEFRETGALSLLEILGLWIHWIIGGRREPGLDALPPQWQVQMQRYNTTTALPRLSNSHCSPPFLHSWERLDRLQILYGGFLGRYDTCSALYVVEVIVISWWWEALVRHICVKIGYIIILVRSINSPLQSRHEERGIFTSVREQSNNLN